MTWVGGWGINIAAGGKAQGSTEASAKLANLIQSTGEFSIEAWVAPGNVTQTNADIVSYSGSDTTRNVTLSQHLQQYEAEVHSSVTNANGDPAVPDQRDAIRSRRPRCSTSCSPTIRSTAAAST